MTSKGFPHQAALPEVMMRGIWMAACVGLVVGIGPLRVCEGETVVETIAYGGWERNLRISNAHAELIVTLEVGPRILVYRLLGQPGGESPNVLKVVEGELGTSGEPKWVPRGGHRLWTAPEDLTRTYAPDNAAVKHEVLADGTVRLTPQADEAYGIQKQMDIKLAEDGAGVRVTHRITNVGPETTELAVWALTVLAPGGTEVIPMPAGRPHPGPPEEAESPADYAADRVLVLWPYFDFTDPRWDFGSRYILLRQDEERGPTKVGMMNREGWAAYGYQGVTFVKRIPALSEVQGKPAVYPDGGCNFETFSNQDMLEMESLSPIYRLEPGASAEHVEEWDLIAGVGSPVSEGLIERELAPRLRAKR